eukprot:1685220-Rhodomonas_salina.1
MSLGLRVVPGHVLAAEVNVLFAALFSQYQTDSHSQIKCIRLHSRYKVYFESGFVSLIRQGD